LASDNLPRVAEVYHIRTAAKCDSLFAGKGEKLMQEQNIDFEQFFKPSGWLAADCDVMDGFNILIETRDSVNSWLCCCL